MQKGFLAWIKDLEEELHGCTDCYNFSGSGILEPTEMLLEHSRSAQSMLALRLEEPNPWGHPKLIDSVAKKYSIVDTDRILITSGASIAIFLVCRTLLAEGDHVIIETPVYEPFLATAAFLKAKTTPLRRTQNDFRIDLKELESLMTPQTKLIILSNLHNPSGAFLEDEWLRDIAAMAQKFKIKVLVDEIFHDFVEEKQQPAATLNDSFISINSLSKVYGLSMLRCGWILASPEVIDRIREVQVIVENIGSRLTQVLASIVLEHASDYKEHWTHLLSKNRQIVQEMMNPLLEQGLLIGDIPSEGCLFFPKIVGVADIRTLSRKLGEQRRVFVSPGCFFGAPDHIRIGFDGNSEELEVGLKLLADEIKTSLFRSE